MSAGTYTVAVVGATGLVGEQIIRLLTEREFPVAELRSYASDRTAGGVVEADDLDVDVELLYRADFDGVDLAFFAATEAVSAEWIGRATGAGTIVIDLSQLHADDPAVPLVLAEVNSAALAELAHGIVATPSSAAIQLACVLKPLQEVAGLRRVVVSSYEPVSGAGRAGVEELSQQTIELLGGRNAEASVFPQRIAFSTLPHIGEFLIGGSTRGEAQLIGQLRRALSTPDLAIAATRVWVPLFFGLGQSVFIETEAPLSASAARQVLLDTPSLLVQDDPVAAVYPTPMSAVGTDPVCVGRIRDDDSVANGLGLWITGDNVRSAALNAVAIAELLVRDELIGRV